MSEDCCCLLQSNHHMERHRGDASHLHSDDYMYHQPNMNFDHPQDNLAPDFHHHRHQHHPHYHPNGSAGEAFDGGSNNHSSSFSGRKRQFSLAAQGSSNDCPEGGNYVKLYVVGIPRTVTEGEIRSVFGEHGHIVEVVMLWNKQTGQQQECCFVKYATLEEADRAVEALSGQYTFPGGVLPVKVRYADKERERLGLVFGAHVHKLYVGCVNRQASKRDIEEIFSPYGVVEDVFIVRNELKQSRGSAFVQFTRRDMAVAAINALHGTYLMRGCDQPLIVRFADPKKPKTGDIMPTAFTNGPQGGPLQPNHSTTSSQSPQSKPGFVPGSCPASEQVFPPSTTVQAGISILMDDSLDCDWSEHICPDGYTYYYNCATCESRWEKPEEYAKFEEQLDMLEQQQTSRPEEQAQLQSSSQHIQWSSSSAMETIS